MLGIDQVDVNVTGIFYRFQDGTFGDFMEDDTSGVFRFQFQHFVQVPCDGFPFAVLIGSQPYGFCLLGFFFQLGYEFLFIRRYLVMRFEVFVYVNTEFFFLQITYMTVAGKDFEIFSKEFLDGFCFRRRLDYDKVFLHKFLFFSDSRH